MSLETSVADRELTVLKFIGQQSQKQVNMFLAQRDKAEQEKNLNEETKDEQINTSSQPKGIIIGSNQMDINEDDELAAACRLIKENE